MCRSKLEKRLSLKCSELAKASGLTFYIESRFDSITSGGVVEEAEGKCHGGGDGKDGGSRGGEGGADENRRDGDHSGHTGTVAMGYGAWPLSKAACRMVEVYSPSPCLPYLIQGLLCEDDAVVFCVADLLVTLLSADTAALQGARCVQI